MRKSIHTDGQQLLQSLLRERRLQLGLRQKDIAQRLNEPQSFVSKYESGERRLDFLELYEICSVMDLSVEGFARLFEERINAGE